MGSFICEFEGAGVAMASGCSGPGERLPLMSEPATYLHGSLSTSGGSCRLVDSPLLVSCIVNLSTVVHAHIKTHVVSTNVETAMFFGFIFRSLLGIMFFRSYLESYAEARYWPATSRPATSIGNPRMKCLRCCKA